MNDKKIRKLVLAALLAALVCVATMVVQIPSPVQGYVNLGDCFVLLSGWLLGPWYGFAAGGIGSMLADIFLGYAHYAPGTLVIKGGVALVAALMYEKMGRTATSRIAGGVVSEIIMVLGYFGYASLLLGKGLAQHYQKYGPHLLPGQYHPPEVRQKSAPWPTSPFRLPEHLQYRWMPALQSE